MGPHVTQEGVRFDAPADGVVCRARTKDGLFACELTPGHRGLHVTRQGISFDDDGAARDAEGRLLELTELRVTQKEISFE